MRNGARWARPSSAIFKYIIVDAHHYRRVYSHHTKILYRTYLKIVVCRPANLENVFRGTFRVKKRDLPAKSGTVGRAHIDIFFRSIQPTEINCVPKYTVARRFGRGTVWYFCEKSNGISVITFNWVIDINVGEIARAKKIRLRTKRGTFP